MAPPYPAILIGGLPPAQTGRLLLQLSAALVECEVPHYGLAMTDNPGDTGSGAPAGPLRLLRDRGSPAWGDAFLALLGEAITRRHLPLLLDAGSIPAPRLDQLVARGTHMILLAPEPGALALWRELAGAHGLPLIGELQLAPGTPPVLHDRGPVLRGSIGDPASDSPAFAALLSRLCQICAYNAETLFRAHRALLWDIDLVLHIERPIHPLPAHDPREQPWQAAELPALLASLPTDEPLASYGRGPAWLVAALAVFSAPQPFAVFDQRLGWVRLPPTTETTGATTSTWQFKQIAPDQVQLQMPAERAALLSAADQAELAVPALPSAAGVIIAGDLPAWLVAHAARSSSAQPWVAVQDAAHPGSAVVVASRSPVYPIGCKIACLPESSENRTQA